jgi:hypothetical protein
MTTGVELLVLLLTAAAPASGASATMPRALTSGSATIIRGLPFGTSTAITMSLRVPAV